MFTVSVAKSNYIWGQFGHPCSCFQSGGHLQHTYPTHRMGKKRWAKVLANLESAIDEAKRVEGVSRSKYQQKIKKLESVLAALLNVIQHRGNRGPVRWPRERRQRRAS